MLARTLLVSIFGGCACLLLPPAHAQVESLALPGLEGAYGGFAGVTHETTFDFGQSFPGVASAWLDVTGQVSLPFPVDVGFQVALDGGFGPPQIESQLSVFDVSVVVEVRDSVLDGQGLIGLNAFPQFCCDHQVFVTSATLNFAIEPFESVKLTPAEISWQPVGNAGEHDVVIGDLTTLVSSGGDFAGATTGCLAADQNGTSQVFDATPAAGTGAWILVRAGDGSYDSGAASQVGSRDNEIRLSEDDCP